MDISDYFEVVSTSGRVFHFRLKGFLSDAVVAEIAEPFYDKWCAEVDSMQGEAFLTLADTTQFKPPAESAKALIGKCMKYGKEKGLYKTVEVMPSAITKMAVRQSAEQTGHDDFRVVVSSVDEAIEKVNELKPQL